MDNFEELEMTKNKTLKARVFAKGQKFLISP
jgi:hypothetical protein